MGNPMKPAAVVYATRAGHTRRIADAIARGLGKQGLSTRLIDLGEQAPSAGLEGFGSVVVAAPVRMGRFAPQVVTFVKKHRSELERMPSAFVAVSLSEAGVEHTEATAKRRAKLADYVRRVNERFFRQTGWHPTRIKSVAGALAYSRYNSLLRPLMQYFARRCGGSTDTSRDHEYTDWGALSQTVDAWAKEILAAGGVNPGDRRP
jgi:menaquinone-dependent protoporphyrinogen oxidase